MQRVTKEVPRSLVAERHHWIKHRQVQWRERRCVVDGQLLDWLLSGGVSQ